MNYCPSKNKHDFSLLPTLSMTIFIRIQCIYGCTYSWHLFHIELNTSLYFYIIIGYIHIYSLFIYYVFILHLPCTYISYLLEVSVLRLELKIYKDCSTYISKWHQVLTNINIYICIYIYTILYYILCMDIWYS